MCISLQPFKVWLWPRYHLKAYSVLFPLISKSQFLNLGHCDSFCWIRSHMIFVFFPGDPRLDFPLYFCFLRGSRGLIFLCTFVSWEDQAPCLSFFSGRCPVASQTCFTLVSCDRQDLHLNCSAFCYELYPILHYDSRLCEVIWNVMRSRPAWNYFSHAFPWK